jgi:hypothetical protein
MRRVGRGARGSARSDGGRRAEARAHTVPRARSSSDSSQHVLGRLEVDSSWSTCHNGESGGRTAHSSCLAATWPSARKASRPGERWGPTPSSQSTAVYPERARERETDEAKRRDGAPPLRFITSPVSSASRRRAGYSQVRLPIGIPPPPRGPRRRRSEHGFVPWRRAWCRG